MAIKSYCYTILQYLVAIKSYCYTVLQYLVAIKSYCSCLARLYCMLGDTQLLAMLTQYFKCLLLHPHNHTNSQLTEKYHASDAYSSMSHTHSL